MGERPSGEPAEDDRYRQIYEGVALPVLMIDAESWTILAVNDAAVAQYGYSREEFVGLPVLEVRPPEGRDEALKILSEMPHGFWKTTAVRHQRKDGSTFDADVWSRDTEVDSTAVRICTVSDVTERVHLERELRQAQKMEAVGRLAGGIAHDINNTMVSVIGGAELLLDELASSDEVTEQLGDIRSAAERAASLTRKLLAFSRQQVMRVELVRLADIYRKIESQVVETVGPVIEIRTRFDDESWPVRVDPHQIEQVIMNLVSNARDAMPDGGTLTLETRNVSRPRDTSGHAPSLPAGDVVELTVEDTGVGMDDVTRVHLFEPFFTTKPPPIGTGLGLSVAYGIIRQCGGSITVESAPGQGSTFRILIPRGDRPGAA